MKLAFWQTHTDGDKYGFSRKKEISRLGACLRGQTAIDGLPALPSELKTREGWSRYEDEDDNWFGFKNVKSFLQAVDYEAGDVYLGYNKGQEITIYKTVVPNSILEVRGTPRNNDVIVDKSVYIDFDVAKSNIQATVDYRIAGS